MKHVIPTCCYCFIVFDDLRVVGGVYADYAYLRSVLCLFAVSGLHAHYADLSWASFVSSMRRSR